MNYSNFIPKNKRQTKEYPRTPKRAKPQKTNQTKPFGGINIVFSGDMRQLEPVGENKKPVYEQECPIF